MVDLSPVNSCSGQAYSPPAKSSFLASLDSVNVQLNPVIMHVMNVIYFSVWGLYADTRPKPGASCQDDDVEDWDQGIVTPYSVKSVIYVNHKPVPLAAPTVGLQIQPSFNQSPSHQPVSDDESSSEEETGGKWDFGSSRLKKEPYGGRNSPKKLHPKEPNTATSTYKPAVTKPRLPESSSIFTAQLKREGATCLTHLEKGGTNLGLSQRLTQCLKTVSNPYVTVLYMIEYAKDYCNSKYLNPFQLAADLCQSGNLVRFSGYGL